MNLTDALRLAYLEGVKLALAEKRFGPFVFKIDRPKGYVKTWDQPDGSVKKYTYPVDYGYLVRHTGEDGEGLDFFVGDDAGAPVESFMKLKPGADGKMVEDETKFMIGLTAAERAKVLALYKDGELVDHRKYKDVYELVAHLASFRGKKKTANLAMLRRLNHFEELAAHANPQLKAVGQRLLNQVATAVPKPIAPQGPMMLERAMRPLARA